MEYLAWLLRSERHALLLGSFLIHPVFLTYNEMDTPATMSLFSCDNISKLFNYHVSWVGLGGGIIKSVLNAHESQCAVIQTDCILHKLAQYNWCKPKSSSRSVSFWPGGLFCLFGWFNFCKIATWEKKMDSNHRSSQPSCQILTNSLGSPAPCTQVSMHFIITLWLLPRRFACLHTAANLLVWIAVCATTYYECIPLWDPNKLCAAWIIIQQGTFRLPASRCHSVLHFWCNCSTLITIFAF